MQYEPTAPGKEQPDDGVDDDMAIELPKSGEDPTATDGDLPEITHLAPARGRRTRRAVARVIESESSGEEDEEGDEGGMNSDGCAGELLRGCVKRSYDRIHVDGGRELPCPSKSASASHSLQYPYPPTRQSLKGRRQV